MGIRKWKEKKRGRIGHSFPFPKKSFVLISNPDDPNINSLLYHHHRSSFKHLLGERQVKRPSLNCRVNFPPSPFMISSTKYSINRSCSYRERTFYISPGKATHARTHLHSPRSMMMRIPSIYLSFIHSFFNYNYTTPTIGEHRMTFYFIFFTSDVCLILVVKVLTNYH